MFQGMDGSIDTQKIQFVTTPFMNDHTYLITVLKITVLYTILYMYKIIAKSKGYIMLTSNAIKPPCHVHPFVFPMQSIASALISL